MRIVNFIKNYPFTIFSVILLLVSISVILIEGKVYASAEKAREDCTCSNICLPKGKNIYPTSTVPCQQNFYEITQPCFCKTNEDYTGNDFLVMYGAWEECALIAGCSSSCAEPCKPEDCNRECTNHCKAYTYKSYCLKKVSQDGNSYECKGCMYDYKETLPNGYIIEHKRTCKKSDCR